MKKLFSTLLIVCVAGFGFPLPAQAGMLPSDAGIVSADRERIAVILDREEVRRELHAHGVDPAEVKARVAALTDEEAAQLASRIDTLPAGGVLGVILLVFVILLITDILGLTKIFPFTRPVR